MELGNRGLKQAGLYDRYVAGMVKMMERPLGRKSRCLEEHVFASEDFPLASLVRYGTLYESCTEVVCTSRIQTSITSLLPPPKKKKKRKREKKKRNLEVKSPRIAARGGGEKGTPKVVGG